MKQFHNSGKNGFKDTALYKTVLTLRNTVEFRSFCFPLNLENAFSFEQVSKNMRLTAYFAVIPNNRVAHQSRLLFE